MRRERTAIGTTVVAIVVLLALLVSIVIYYNTQLTQQSASSRSQFESLQNSIGALQNKINEIQFQSSSSSTVTTRVTDGLPSIQGLDPTRIYAMANLSIVTVQGAQVTVTNGLFGRQTSVQDVLGSGFVTTYQNSTYVITNFHVVDGVTNMTVTFPDADSYPATVVGTDAYSDLAVVSVKAPSSEYHTLRIVHSSSVVVGQSVIVIGNPFGLAGSMTYGIVSQLGRTIQEQTAGGFLISGVIQFSAPINPGNSGGPLLDSEGQVIGITTAIVGGSQGVGFAIPADTILRELPFLITNGKYDLHSYLGTGGVDMNYQLAKVSNTNVTYGVLIENVAKGGPAEKAGLMAGTKTVTIGEQQYAVGGDIIVSFNGTRIVNQDALSTYLEQHTLAGQTILVGIIRDGASSTVKVVLGNRPPLQSG